MFKLPTPKAKLVITVVVVIAVLVVVVVLVIVVDVVVIVGVCVLLLCCCLALSVHYLLWLLLHATAARSIGLTVLTARTERTRWSLSTLNCKKRTE